MCYCGRPQSCVVWRIGMSVSSWLKWTTTRACDVSLIHVIRKLILNFSCVIRWMPPECICSKLLHAYASQYAAAKFVRVYTAVGWSAVTAGLALDEIWYIFSYFDRIISLTVWCRGRGVVGCYNRRLSQCHHSRLGQHLTASCSPPGIVNYPGRLLQSFTRRVRRMPP